MSWLETFVVAFIFVCWLTLLGNWVLSSIRDERGMLRWLLRLVAWRLRRPPLDWSQRDAWRERLRWWELERPLRCGCTQATHRSQAYEYARRRLS